ncbi:tyrosine-type recombinase/integrase [Aquirufa aurantiipilula]|uniref:tyrosine-type recombinase/integrase n=1 Tax=Aquirufa aurantiipilula TaxID=2696561 RepID=UPI001CAA75B5|nr:phage integrase SAM-like domain-containing protein [Aquirufa aurantiipilula]MBZ1326540.1 tyrosine-type recombinase/integrase [Aquirufa aurantiipilula]
MKISSTSIFFSEDLSKRSYVYFYINKKRYRIYNASVFGKACTPNQVRGAKARFKELIKLETLVQDELRNGWIPGHVTHYIEELFTNLVQEYHQSAYSKKYIRDCTIVIKELLEYCQTRDLLASEISALTPEAIEIFLKRYNSSNAYYAIKRRTLGAVFSKLVSRGIIEKNPALSTSTKRVEAVHNQAFTDSQLEDVLVKVKNGNKRLYLCSLFMYCMLLRPHKEVRLLKRGNFDEELKTLILSGRENKSKRVRAVPVPDIIRIFLLEGGVDQLPSEYNIFTHQLVPLNESFFSTAWSRVKSKLLKEGFITQYHTLYSFRHTAVCSVFKRDKDLHLVQRLCSHQSMLTSLKYLRSLGMEQVGTLDELPQLNF